MIFPSGKSLLLSSAPLSLINPWTINKSTASRARERAREQVPTETDTYREKERNQLIRLSRKDKIYLEEEEDRQKRLFLLLPTSFMLCML